MAFLIHKDVDVKDIQPRGSRLMLLTLRTTPETHLVNIHAPTAEATEESKDLFYTQLIELLDELHHSDKITIILGDFNARVYSVEGPAAATVFGRYHFNRGADEDQAERALQNASIGVTDNRARMIELATTHNMVATTQKGSRTNVLELSGTAQS